MIRGLVSSLRTFTIFPVPGRDADDLSQALPWFPVAGALIALVLLAAARFFFRASGGWPEGAAVVFVAGSAIITRGLHLDGLSDFADGFFGARDKERVLAIMKDSRVGAFGVTALVVVLLAKWAALSRMFGAGTGTMSVAVYAVSRLAMTDLAVRLPYARAEGGTGGAFVSGAKNSHFVYAALAAIVIVFAAANFVGVLLLVSGMVLARVLGAWYVRRIDGVTGDLLGAANELVETFLFMVCAAFFSAP